jgi:hypothetical protein
VLHREVLVARGSAREASMEADIDRDTEQLLKERLQKTPVSAADLPDVRKQIREQVKAVYQVVPPGYTREWRIDLGRNKNQLRDRPIQVRIKFNSADRSPSGTFTGLWAAGAPPKTPLQRLEPMRLAPDTFHELEFQPNLMDENGILTLTFLNANTTALLFPLEDGMEVLYHEGGFALNFVRGLGIIFCWMALLTTIGLAAASFLSFPVAAFFSMGMLTLALSSGTLANAVSEGTLTGYNAEKGAPGHTAVDTVAIPVFRGVLTVINLAKQFSPIDSLSSGRSITWGQLGLAFSQIVLLLGGFFGLVGIAAFSRRELATAQGTQ